MEKTANFLPKGYHTTTAYLVVDQAEKAIEFYKKTFGATELFRMPAPGGKIGHAEIKIGDSPLMLADALPHMEYKSPKTLGGTPVSLLVYVEDADVVVKTAVDNGAKILKPIANQFYGDRSGMVEDPFGHVWTIATHIEDVSPEEMKKRIAALPSQCDNK